MGADAAIPLAGLVGLLAAGPALAAFAKAHATSKATDNDRLARLELLITHLRPFCSAAGKMFA
jgi:hypothetical protein